MRRRSYYRGQSRKAGLPPGTLVHTGALAAGESNVSVISYSSGDMREYRPPGLDQCIPVKGTGKVTWINLEGLHDLKLIRHFGDCYGLHPLILEDIANTSQRPKLEDYGDHLFIVARMIRFQHERGFETEQVAMVLGSGYLFSFQEGLAGDVFETVRERVRSGRGRIRSQGADYLAYALLDAIVDSYFTVLEQVGEELEDLEEELAREPTPAILKRIIWLKREVILMRKSVWPLRELTAALERGESELLSDTARVYFRDIYDHSIQVLDGVETFRDLLSGMLDLYLSSIGNRTNEVMKFLTVIGTIFLPLTFLVGVYGMNFRNMPELRWPYGYFDLWGVMLAIALGMVLYFKKKRWL